mgnify:CR=1 FL=1
MEETGYISRSLGGSEDTHIITAPSGGLEAGEFAIVEDTLYIAMDDIDAADDGVGVYRNRKIVVNKDSGAGTALEVGDKVYYNATTGKVTPTVGANRLCGRCNEAALTTDTTVEIDFDGTLA